jgi:ammonia channel protein AmtB
MPALFIGAAAGLVCYLATRAVLRIKKLDDAFGVIACHGVGGTLGMLLLGVFAHYTINPSGLTGPAGAALNGLIFGQARFFGDEVIAVAVVIAFTLIMTYLIGLLVRSTIGLRVPEYEEHQGLNVEFESTAYEQYTAVQ